MRTSKCVPVSKEQLLSLPVRLSGRIGNQWICYVIRGVQFVRPYAPWGDIDPTPWTKPWQDKFALGVKAAQSLSPDLKEYWGRLGSRKKKPLPWWNTFLSSWMLDLVNLETFRHVRNLKY